MDSMRQTSRTICIEPLAGALWGRLELSKLFNFAYKLSVFNTEDTEDCYNLVIDLVFTNFNKFFCTFSVDEHTVKYILVYIRLRHQDSNISIYSTADSNCEIQRLVVSQIYWKASFFSQISNCLTLSTHWQRITRVISTSRVKISH